MIVKLQAHWDGEWWCAEGVGEDVFTQAGTLDELVENIRDALLTHFGPENLPAQFLLLTDVEVPVAQTVAG